MKMLSEVYQILKSEHFYSIFSPFIKKLSADSLENS